MTALLHPRFDQPSVFICIALLLDFSSWHGSWHQHIPLIFSSLPLLDRCVPKNMFHIQRSIFSSWKHCPDLEVYPAAYPDFACPSQPWVSSSRKGAAVESCNLHVALVARQEQSWWLACCILGSANPVFICIALLLDLSSWHGSWHQHIRLIFSCLFTWQVWYQAYFQIQRSIFSEHHRHLPHVESMHFCSNKHTDGLATAVISTSL